MTVGELVRYGVKSVGGLVVNLVLLTVLVEIGGIRPEIALLVNWVVVSVFGYLILDGWVFQFETDGSLAGHARRYVGLQGVMIVGKVFNYAIYVGLIWWGIDYRVAWVIGAVVVFCGTFVGNRAVWSRFRGNTSIP